MRTLCSWLAGILFLGCLALGWLLWRQQAQFQRAAAARAVADRATDGATAELHQKIAAAKQAQAAAERKAEDLAKRSAAAAPSYAGAFVAANGNIRFRVKQVRLSDVAKDHPDFPAILAKQQLRSIVMNYGDAVNQLDLPPDERSELLRLLADRQSTQSDFWLSSQAAGLQANSPDGQQAMRQVTDEVDQQIGSLVNQDGKAFVNQLQSTMGPKTMIKFNYAPDFEDAGVPLSPDQSAGLAQALAAPQADQKQNPAPAWDDSRSPLLPSQQRQLARAAAVLSPAQLKIFQGTLEDQAVERSIYRQYTKGGGSFSIEP